jgi:hypothetical protein
MSQEDRRAFLKKLAKGTVYAAPVVHSLAAPLDLVGQGKSSEHKRERGSRAATASPGGSSVTQQTDIGAPPPGQQPPPGQPNRPPFQR